MNGVWLKYKIEYIPIFLLSFVLSLCWHAGKQPPSQPGIGSIHGMRLEIPAEYVFFPVEYDGDEIWTQPQKRHEPGPDVPIRSFSLLLHYPNFAPLSDQNRDSWNGRKGPNARANEWIDVGVRPIDGIGNDAPLWFSKFIKDRMDTQVSGRPENDWYFKRQPGLVYGLVSEKKIGPDYSKISMENADIFYDEDRSRTYIKCGAGAGGEKFCKQEFIINKLDVLVTAHYSRDNIKDWRVIQNQVSAIVLSFVRTM
jgi:hypothetical protein